MTTISSKFKKPIDAVVSLDQNRGMGYRGDLLLRLKADMAWFKELTTSNHNSTKNAIIMGRKTWESIPDRFRPLPNRVNYVLTSRPEQVQTNSKNKENQSAPIYAFSSWNEILSHAYREAEALFVIGGAQVFAEALARPEFRYLYVTEFATTFDADTFFPAFKMLLPNKMIINTGSESGVTFSIVRYSK